LDAFVEDGLKYGGSFSLFADFDKCGFFAGKVSQVLHTNASATRTFGGFGHDMILFSKLIGNDRNLSVFTTSYFSRF
jgi:hypothetical protein